MTHPPEHERLLLRALAGSKSIDAIDACPECQRALSQIRELESSLDACGEYERTSLQRTLAPRPHGVGERTRRRGALAWAAALAAGLLFLVGWRMLAPPTELALSPSELHSSLGPSDPACIAPRGPSSDFNEFRWQAERPPDGCFQVVVYGRGESEPLLMSPRLTDARWTPTRSATRTWPDDITWELRILDALHELVGTAAAEASR